MGWCTAVLSVLAVVQALAETLRLQPVCGMAVLFNLLLVRLSTYRCIELEHDGSVPFPWDMKKIRLERGQNWLETTV